MSGYETLVPSMSSDPQARIWAKMRSMELRLNALEAKRDVIYRASGGGSPAPGETEFQWRFRCSGRPLLFHIGPNHDYVGAAVESTEPIPRTRQVHFDIATPTPVRITTTASNFSSVAALVPTPATSRLIEGVPPGEYTVTVWGSEFIRATWLVLELPA
jgi:hypothetical protein